MLEDICKYINEKIDKRIEIAIVTGSGLSSVKNILTNPVCIKYSDIPGYFNTTVKGHDGSFYFGDYKGKYIYISPCFSRTFFLQKPLTNEMYSCMIDIVIIDERSKL